MGQGGEWLLFEGTDVIPDERVGRPLPATAEEDIAALKRDCLELGYGGFVVKRGMATFRPYNRSFLLEHKMASLWERGSTLHIAPEAVERVNLVQVHCGERSAWADPTTLAAKSGYFASVFRHAWADAEGCHRFGSFPGGDRAFAMAMAWLSADEGAAVGEPWPLRDQSDVCLAILAAAYLASPKLLRASVRSWSLAAERVRDERLAVASAIVEASLQFEGEEQDLVISELKVLLHEVPRHQLLLVPEFLVAPAAGLAILEARQSAGETLVSKLRSVGGWVGSVIVGSGSDRAAHGPAVDVPFTPSDFAVQLFDQHEPYFLARLPALRQLLGHVDALAPIAPPLCFRIAAAAFAATSVDEDDAFAGRQFAVDIFERSLGAAECPAEIAADPACVSGLFGAGGRAVGSSMLGLDVLARPLVPPAAAAVVLSRVLSSWAAGESREGGADAADVILAGVVSDRQQLRTMLNIALPRIAEEAVPETGSDWGTCFDYAVPELRAALQHAVTSGDLNDTVRLLFRVLFQPTGGLPGLRFPLTLLAELRSHNTTCICQAARCAVSRLREVFRLEEEPRRSWKLAEDTWPCIAWDLADVSLLEEAVEMLREWLLVAKRAAETPEGRAARASAKLAATRLLLQLPLHQLPAPEVLLGPPVPAHVLAALAHRGAERTASRLAALQAENEALRGDLARLSIEVRRTT